MIRTRLLFVIASVAVAAGCADRGPLDPAAPVPAEPARLERLECRAELGATPTVSCRAPDAAPGGARASYSVIMGGQGVLVRILTGNVAITADTFAFDLRVQNLRGAPIGTLDGTTADPAGSKVFFSDAPPVSTTQGTGQVTVANADGVGTFTASNQPYFQYVERIAPNDTSAAKRWKLRFDPGVQHFTFHLFVQTSTGLVFSSVKAGPYHTCAVDADGRAQCWGQEPGTVLQLLEPTHFPLDSVIAQIGAGSDKCALTPGGHALCWSDGYLGGGSTLGRNVGGPAFDSLSVGGTVACGLTAAGQAFCWGANNWGQLGNGTLTNATSPQPVAGGLTFAQISVGANRVCGVTTGGSAYCWGNNEYGALGASTTEQCPQGSQSYPCSSVPVAVSGGLSFAAVSVAEAGNFACARTGAGAAYCWGHEETGFGNLGTGTPGDAASPALVAGGHVFSAIDVGDYHTCGLEGGKAWCWGKDFVGINSAIPAAIPGTLSFTTVSAGSHTCGMATDGNAWCWGRNSEGELGNGTTTSSATPVKAAKQF